MGKDPYLEHYGVKGMKWGVRNDRRQAKRDRAFQRRTGLVRDNSSGTARDVKTGKLAALAPDKRSANLATRNAQARQFSEDLVKQALKTPSDLYRLNGNILLNGADFAKYMQLGGVMDARTTHLAFVEAK